MNSQYQLSAYNYFLPESAIAQTPCIPHHDAKLLVCKRKNWSYHYTDHTFIDLPDLLTERDVLFFNDSKVINARIPLSEVSVTRHSGFKTILTQWEIFVYHIIDTHRFEALVSDDKNFKPWSKLWYTDTIVFNCIKLTPSGVLIEIEGTDLKSFLRQYAQLPLPPYIKYAKEKEARYQTVFAEKEGSAAAPTASLHFTQTLLAHLDTKGIQKHFLTLHIGLGTFKPITTSTITDYTIHSESVVVPTTLFKLLATYKVHHKRIIPVGTTMIRTLESLPFLYQQLKKDKNIQILWLSPKEQNFWENISTQCTDTEDNIITSYKFSGHTLKFHTQIYIYPWVEFKLTDAIITNFHLPKSSLIILVSAWMGKEETHKAYRYALEHGYRFYSFWDGMLIE